MPRRIILPYASGLKERALELRNNCTRTEYFLWQYLKGTFNSHYDFHRQKPLLYWIADFYCVELRLVIEIDGTIHNTTEQREKDYFKEEGLNEVGLNVLRFTNHDVLYRTKDVLTIIEQYIRCFETKDWEYFKEDGRYLNRLTRALPERVLVVGINEDGVVIRLR